MDVPFIPFFTFGIVLWYLQLPVGLDSCINWQKEKNGFI